MARLKFNGATDEYHPATGLLLKAGEAEYPDDKVEALFATGRFETVEVDPAPATRRGKADKDKE